MQKNILQNKGQVEFKTFSFTMLLFAIWLISNILFPGEFGAVKNGLTLILIVSGILHIAYTGLLPDFNILGGLLAFLTLALLSIWYGESNGFINGGATSVFVLRPVLIVFLIANFNIANDRQRFFTVIDASAIILLLYNFIYVMGALGVIPQLFSWELDNGNVTSTSATFIAARLTNQGALTFFLPYVAIRLEKISKKFNLMYVSFILGIIASLLSGRRIVQIVAIAVIFYTLIRVKSLTVGYVFRMFVKLVLSIFVILLVGSIVSSLLNIQNVFFTIYETIADAFDADTASSIIRASQAQYLIEGWKSHPLIGQGLNSYVTSYIRNYDSPWSYEYVYYAFLYQIGIFGIFLLVSMVIGITKPLLQNISCNEDKSLLVAFIFFLVAAASNPMFTNMWVWVIMLSGYEFSKYEQKIRRQPIG